MAANDNPLRSGETVNERWSMETELLTNQEKKLGEMYRIKATTSISAITHLAPHHLCIKMGKNVACKRIVKRQQ